MNPLHLEIVIDAQNKIDGVMKDVSGQFSTLGTQIDKLQPAFKAMAGVGVAAFAGVAAAAGVAVKGFIDDQKDMALATSVLRTTLEGMATEDLGSVAEGATDVGEAMRQLTQNMTMASEAALQLGFDDETASVAFTKLFAVTKNVGQAQRDLKLAMDLAAFSGRDLESAATAITQVHAGGTRVLKEFGIEAEEGATVMDVLALAQERVGGTAEKMSQTMGTQLEILRLRWDNIKSAIGGAILDAIQPLLEKITPVIEKMTKWAEENPKLIVTIMAVVAAVGAVLAVVGTLGLAIPAIIAGFSALATAGGAVITIFGILLGPVGLVIAIIAALVAGVILLIKNWDTVKAKASEVWDAVKQKFEDVFNGIKQILDTVWKAIQEAFWTGINFMIGVIKAFLDFFFPGWNEALQLILQATIFVWDAVKNTIGAALGFILNNIVLPILNGIKSVWEFVWGSISSYFTMVVDGIKSVAEAVFGWINDQINALMGPLDALLGLAQKAIDLAKSAASAVGRAVTSAVSSGRSITGRAAGGPVGNDRAYMVGERGPEMFYPNGAGRIAAHGAGAGGIVINISGNDFIGREGIAQQIGDDLIKVLKRNIKL